MNSMKIGTYQMDTSFGLYLPEYTIPAPTPQTNFVQIIGRDGSVDLSEAIGLHYDSRVWDLDFKCFDPTVNWHTLTSQVMNAIHGKRLNFEFDDDPNYFWTGRVSVSSYVSNHGTGTLKINITSDPFKYAKLSTIVTKNASTGTDYTGALVSFNTANAKINDLSVTMQPIQDLHGYSHPWPSGGGKNKFLTTLETGTKNQVTASVDSDGFIHLSGTANATTIFQIGRYTFAAGEYYITMCPPGGSTSTYRVYASFGSNDTGNGWTRTFTQETEVTFQININSGMNTDGLVFKPMICLSSEGTDFAPYANICPIAGRTGLSVYRTGKNLFDPDSLETVTVNTGERFGHKYSGVGTYAIKAYATGTFGYVYARVLNTDGTWGSVYYVVANTTATAQTVTVSAGQTLFVYNANTWTESASSELFNGWKVQVVLSSTQPDSYEPYNGNTYAVDWTTQAGTVYGGTLDVVTGALTVSWACASRRLSTFNLIETKTNTKHYRYLDNFFGGSLPADAGSGNLCNIAPNAYNSSDATHFYTVKSNGRIELWVPVDLSTDTEVQIAAHIATPLTYQLTPQEIEALVGTNNVWSDGGNVTVAVVTPETLTNNGRAVVPTLTASADMVLKWGNYSASVQQGTSTVPQLILENGANLIYIIGTGTLSFSWQEASL